MIKHIKNPLLARLVYKIRDSNTKSEEFRASLEKIGEYLGYEIARDLETTAKTIVTPMNETAQQNILVEQPTLITILRAGIPLYSGMQRAFAQAEVGFIGAMRNEETLKSRIDYIALPNLENKTIILCDTMLATGGSLIDAAEIIKSRKPKQIIIASAIASKQGIRKIFSYDSKINLYLAAIDPRLNKQGYILPGLGDAGDRCYGRKV